MNGSLVIQCFVCNPYMQNTYVVHAKGKNECLIIDAGMYTPDEQQAVAEYIRHEQLTVAAVLITHAHQDHICGTEWLKQTYPAAQTVDYSYLRNTYNAHEPQLCLAGLNIRCLFTPGHKEDCVCYYLTDEGVLFSGDTLFRQSVGRTDLPGGNYSVLIQSLHDLLQLPADTTVYPGHSEPTTIGYEQQYNPFAHRLR